MRARPEVILECALKYARRGPGDLPPAEGEAEARLSEATLALLPRLGEPLHFTLREITRVTAKDYRLHLLLASGEELTLFHLGYRYDDFRRVLSRLRNELMIKDLLMHEKLLQAGLKARYVRITGAGIEERGNCELRLYETGLVIISPSRRTRSAYPTAT